MWLFAQFGGPTTNETDPVAMLGDWTTQLKDDMFAGYVTELVSGLGAIVSVIVAAFFAFLLIRKALRWARSGF
jgi:hypothetical protein